jgi:hypothetical protein
MADPAACGLVRLLVTPVIARAGGAYVIVIDAVRAFPAPSVATTVNTLGPTDRVTLRLQFAVELPVNPLATVTPLTVTLAMPLLPVLPSVAVPLNVMPLDVTVWPDV